MKRLLLLLLSACLCCFLHAREDGRDSLDRGIVMHAVTLYGDRPLKETGVQRTRFDSLMLKENVALSMADILTYNASVFVKNYGRATLSTVAFRGTSASHTRVTWNGMRIYNPMVGMTDFSMIPSYFIDDASLLHGTSSVNETGGGIGGAVKLATVPAKAQGFGLQYMQGVGSFRTFDEFLRLTYGNRRWQFSTRAVCASSSNDYRYRNHDKKENIYDDNMHIVDQYYPVERNRSGAFEDFHVLQEAYCNTRKGDKFGLNAWYTRSRRELALLTTDYGDNKNFENFQREHTFRGVLSWNRLKGNWKADARAGYIHTRMAYDYIRDLGNGVMVVMARSRSKINTLYARVQGEYYLGDKWLFTADAALHQHFVESRDKNIILQDGNSGIVGYRKARVELSGSLSAKWRPVKGLGVAAVLREEMYGNDRAPLIPALFLDAVLSKKGNVVLKVSTSKNYRFPTLNDQYFLPGGNPKLLKESGWTGDAGISFDLGRDSVYRAGASVNAFNSYIDNWIIWLPTTKGFFSPRNLKKVHAYGVEVRGNGVFTLSKDWGMELNATFSWTPSVNAGEPLSPADRSVGRQLPYIPEFSANVTGRLVWRSWSFIYKWCYYSRRYTMSSNDFTLTGRLPEYFMSNVVLEKGFSLPWADLSLKATVNNLFDEQYLSILSHPMPGIHFEIFLGITPKWRKACRGEP